VDEFLGTSHDRKVVEIKFDEAYLSGYALYTFGGKLSKVLLINHEAHLSGAPFRPSYSVSLKGIEGLSLPRGRTVTLKRLIIPHADVETGLTWAGQSYDSAVPNGKLNFKRQSVEQLVIVEATQIVMVEF
jgi:hypothetical protein